jgi:basic amino acid/polyamine antiporter, APA family
MSNPSESLLRVIGVRQLAAGIVNATVGAGIFVVPAVAAMELGAGAPLAFLVCGAAMALIVTALAGAGSRVSVTGGIYAYAEVAFGPFAGFLVGVIQWLSFVLAVAGVAVALLDQAGTLIPALTALPARLVVLVLVLVLLATINARGASLGSRTIETFTVAKLAPLLLFVAVGVLALQPGALIWPGAVDADALGRASLIIIFAFLGVEVALAPSGEIRDPGRTVPRAIYLALILTTLLYIAIQLVAQGTLGAELAKTQAPLAEASARFLGPAGRTLILLGALCSMFGYLSGDMLSSPRTLYVFARDGFLPGFLAAVHPTSRTPRAAIWTHAAIVFVLASTGTFQYLALIANVATLSLYFVGCAAAIELARRDVRGGGIPFAVPGGPVIPVIAGGVIIWILSHATWQEFAATGAAIVAAALLYFIRSRRVPSSVEPLKPGA